MRMKYGFASASVWLVLAGCNGAAAPPQNDSGVESAATMQERLIALPVYPLCGSCVIADLCPRIGVDKIGRS